MIKTCPKHILCDPVLSKETLALQLECELWLVLLLMSAALYTKQPEYQRKFSHIF
jgi:hypothetical protein